MKAKYKELELSRANRLMLLSLLDQIEPMPSSKVGFVFDRALIRKSKGTHVSTAKRLLTEGDVWFQALPAHPRYKAAVKYFSTTGKTIPNSPVTRSFTKATLQRNGIKLRKVMRGDNVIILVMQGKTKPRSYPASFYTDAIESNKPLLVIEGRLDLKSVARQHNRRSNNDGRIA